VKLVLHKHKTYTITCFLFLCVFCSISSRESFSSDKIFKLGYDSYVEECNNVNKAVYSSLSVRFLSMESDASKVRTDRTDSQTSGEVYGDESGGCRGQGCRSIPFLLISGSMWNCTH
jgi:hypothetical protein